MLNNIIAVIAISFISMGAIWGIGNLMHPPNQNQIEKSHDTILLVAQNNAFNETNPTLYVKENKPTKLIVLNKDFVKHDFISRDLGIDTAYLTTEQDFVTAIAGDKPGEYVYYCSFHPSMTGKIIITK